jgi:hypothetical protein
LNITAQPFDSEVTPEGIYAGGKYTKTFQKKTSIYEICQVPGDILQRRNGKRFSVRKKAQ